MEDYELRRIVNGYLREICHYSQIQVFATSYYQRKYFQLQIDDRIAALMDIILHYESIPKQA